MIFRFCYVAQKIYASIFCKMMLYERYVNYLVVESGFDIENHVFSRFRDWMFFKIDYYLVVDCKDVLRVSQLMKYAMDRLLQTFGSLFTYFRMIGIGLWSIGRPNVKVCSTLDRARLQFRSIFCRYIIG